MRNEPELIVHIKQDEDSGRWFISETDVPGLWLEAPTAAELVERIRQAAPELIALNAADAAPSRASTNAKTTYHPKVRPVFDSPLDFAA